MTLLLIIPAVPVGILFGFIFFALLPSICAEILGWKDACWDWPKVIGPFAGALGGLMAASLVLAFTFVS